MARRRSLPGRRYLLLAALTVAGGLSAGLLLGRPAAIRPPAPALVPEARPAPARPGPLPQPAETPVTPRPTALPAAPPAPTSPAPLPPRRVPAIARVAVIFDDAGGSLEDIETIIALGRPVTIAVLPGLRFSREVAQRARSAGLEVFLHLPLEAGDSAKALGPGGITSVMSDAEIAAAVREALASVPGAAGVNNHMGSKGTADPRVMRAVLGVVKAQGLIWVDSRTTTATVGAQLASEMGIPAASRHVFLDNEDNAAAIRTQIVRLIEIARWQGEAVAIGHAHRLTAQVLREMLGEFDSVGIELVPASALVR